MTGTDAPPLSLAVVTHARSRFNVDGDAGRRLALLGDALARQGAVVSTLVSDRDDYDSTRYPLSRSDLVRSAWHQSRLELRWRRYLQDGGLSARDAAVFVAMSGRRVVESALGGVWNGAERRYGRIAARRLINIDLSHLRALEQAPADGWVLILEDDARMADPHRTAGAILDLIRTIDTTPVVLASLSESIDPAVLGVQHLLTPAQEHLDGRDVLRASRPVTNTVCATLYRSSFAMEVARRIRSRGLVPVAPIDWRLNEVLLDLWDAEALGPQSCLWVSPGLFMQGSMHA